MRDVWSAGIEYGTISSGGWKSGYPMLVDGIEVREIPNWPKYYVSNSGRVRSEKLRKRWLIPRLNDNRKVVTLFSKERSKHFYCSQLVALAWIGPPPFAGAFVLHKDDNRRNNLHTNLYYGTREDNSKDAVRNQKMAHGERQNKAKLSEEQVLWLLRLNPPREEWPKYAELLSVKYSTIRAILLRITWKHLRLEMENGRAINS